MYELLLKILVYIIQYVKTHKLVFFQHILNPQIVLSCYLMTS